MLLNTERIMAVLAACTSSIHPDRSSKVSQQQNGFVVCHSGQVDTNTPAALAMPPHIIPSMMAAPEGGMNCNWYRCMKNDVNTVAISNSQTSVSSSCKQAEHLTSCEHTYELVRVISCSQATREDAVDRWLHSEHTETYPSEVMACFAVKNYRKCNVNILHSSNQTATSSMLTDHSCYATFPTYVCHGAGPNAVQNC